MTPLAQLVEALLESTDPIIDLPGDPQTMVGAILAPLEQLYDSRDLLIATAVLEAAVPLLQQTSLLWGPQPTGRPV
jgi:hypothetical protein